MHRRQRWRKQCCPTFSWSKIDKSEFVQPVTRIVGNKSVTTDQSGGVTPVVDPLFGVLAEMESDIKFREPATVLLDNYTQAENITLPVAWGSPTGDAARPLWEPFQAIQSSRMVIISERPRLEMYGLMHLCICFADSPDPATWPPWALL